ncbi:hypothetical protein J1614_001334 [Plenodomus biglobosus]|nr:hypothetical protein J1614_001334 [Plenodomus biglobosus]
MKTNNQLLRDKIADLEKQLEREVNERKKSRIAHNRSLCSLQKEIDIAATKLRRMQARESIMAVERQALENEVELLRAEKSEARQEACELQSSLDLDAKTKALDDLDKKHQQLRRRLSEVNVENRKLKEQTEKAKEEVKKGIEKMKFLKSNVRGLVDGF